MALKKDKVNPQEVIDEIRDVKIRLKVLKYFFNEDKIKKRIQFKMDKLKSYIKDGKYIGKM